MSDPRPGLGIDDLWVATLTPDPDARARSLLALAPEHLLLVGGDDRQLPRPGTARNAYGFPVVDLDPVVRGSSCTATPPDSVALADVSAWAGALDASIAGNGLPSADTLHEQVAARLLEHLDFDPTACERVLLTPSGTDAESLVTALVLATTDRSLCNIVVGAAEAGSGTIPAALGRWFSRRTPFCTDVTVEARIPGFPADQVRLVDVELRDHRGRARRAFDVEAEVEAHIEDALERDEHVLVHAMAGSKTELRQLTPDWIRIWRARGAGRVHVVVDAAQARIAPATMRDYLDAGASVAFTGSKALGAPPFCGAIVLDATFMHEVMAAVDSGARLHDAVVLRGGRVGDGAVLVRSVVCAGGIVPRNAVIVDKLITSDGPSGAEEGQ